MGLDIVIYGEKGRRYLNCFRGGSYSYFYNFKRFLVDIATIIYDIRGVKIPLNSEKRLIFQELLFHNDCQGEIKLSDCKRLLKDFELPEFKEALMLLSLDDEYTEYIEGFKESIKDWINGLKLAVKHKGYLEFC